VLLDEKFATGQVFGAGGTPSALLLDGNGRLAPDVAVGAEPILALAGTDLVGLTAKGQ
jgi:hypothetical protein